MAKPNRRLAPGNGATTATWYGKPDVENPRDASGRRKVVGEGMIGRSNDAKQGSLDDYKAGVHAPW